MPKDDDLATLRDKLARIKRLHALIVRLRKARHPEAADKVLEVVNKLEGRKSDLS